MYSCEWCSQPIQTLHHNSFSFSRRQGYFCSERCRRAAFDSGVLGTRHPDPAPAPAPAKGGGCGGTFMWLVLIVVATVLAILVLGQ